MWGSTGIGVRGSVLRVGLYRGCGGWSRDGLLHGMGFRRHMINWEGVLKWSGWGRKLQIRGFIYLWVFCNYGYSVNYGYSAEGVGGRIKGDPLVLEPRSLDKGSCGIGWSV